jgi:hypothetical protein
VDPRLAAAAAWAASRPASVQERVSEAVHAPVEQPAPSPEAPAWEAAPPPAAVPEEPHVDVIALEERATALIASRDPAAGPAAVEAARALADAGKVNAASDLLLHLVAAGIAVHDAERELVRVAQALGRTEIATEREQLLTRVAALG